MKLLAIYNPHAAHDRAQKLLPKIQSQFEQKGIDINTQLTNYPTHGTELVKTADFSLYDGVLACGGDGTLFEVVNGYFHNQSEKRIPIGIIPIGTGNAFARDLELQTGEWEEAIEILAQKKPRKVDVGKFTTHKSTYYYLNILGLGFVSDVTKTALKLKIFGNVSYLLGVFYQTIFLKTHHLTIEMDGQSLEQENIFVEISNTRYTSNFLMAPSAEIDDGYLDVTLLTKCTRRKLLKCLPTVFTGEHIHLDVVDTFKAQKIKIATSIPKVLTPDGEVLCETPVEIECLHKAVEVFGR